jgi:hypothetical protein
MKKPAKSVAAHAEQIGDYLYREVNGELHRSHVNRPDASEFVTVAGKPAEFALRMLRLKAGLPEWSQ